MDKSQERKHNLKKRSKIFKGSKIGQITIVSAFLFSGVALVLGMEFRLLMPGKHSTPKLLNLHDFGSYFFFFFKEKIKYMNTCFSMHKHYRRTEYKS